MKNEIRLALLCMAAAAVPAFAGLSYRDLRDRGALAPGAAAEAAASR